MSDAELRAGLATALGGEIGALRRLPWPYGSSVPVEELRIAGRAPLLFKDLTPRPRPSRPAFLVDPLREVEAYTTLLHGLDAPACHGALVDDERVWLFLELVDGVPLWQADGLAAWEATARWLARMHAAPVPQGVHLLRYDAAHLRRWVDRALAMSSDDLGAVRAPALRAVQRLAAWPAAFVHGELYASNVLVQQTVRGPRVRPVDWETAGIGPGLLDLAALTAGDWPGDRRARVVAAYRDALPATAAGPEFRAALDAARLLVALQWLGWSDDWTPPPGHRHDWAADARALAARIAS
ncbi:MAG: hypothetical protein Q8K79_01500 [Solirubrobacteraceae bacterium]|nr:hypothetical protein [Solirubrobacteraceae bacterium]